MVNATKGIEANEDAEEAKVVDGDIASSASGMLRSPVAMLLGLYVVSDLFGRVMNFFAARQ